MSIFRPGLFQSKVALVTGGGTGIGKAIATELASLGAKVTIASRGKDHLDAAIAEMRETLPQECAENVSSVVMNIRNEAEVNETISGLVRKHGRIDLLVNNGGGQFALPAASIRPKGFRAVIDTNLVGTWLVTHAVYTHNPSPKTCSIVNIIADYFNGFPTMVHTGAARAGVDNLTKTLAREWGADGVRINSVAPGLILSSGIANYPKDMAGHFAKVGSSVPAGRLGSESEVSSAVVFLLSPAAAYITGATLRVDGGGSLYKDDLTLPQSTRNVPAPYHLNHALEKQFNERAPPHLPSQL
jgi:NAD(P)-dependent dehydrogenase (short-subunit alcohol dehydrogenase family)